MFAWERLFRPGWLLVSVAARRKEQGGWGVAHLWLVHIVPVIGVVPVHRSENSGASHFGIVSVVVAGLEDEYRD